MNLTAGDMAAISGVMTTVTTVLGVIVRYFVKAEIKIACDQLRLEWAKDRASVLEQRIHATDAPLRGM